MLQTLYLKDLHQDIVNSDCKHCNNLKKINNLNKKGVLIENTKIKGGIIINNGYYGKCIIPESKLNIYIDDEKEEISIYDCWKKYSLTENYDYDGLGYWFYPKKNILIESIDCNKKIVKRKIRIFYRQKINELIREIELENGYKISITKNHRLLKFNNQKYQWEYELNVNDYICFYNNSKVNISSIKNIKEFQYDNYVYDISIAGTKNYIANGILCHNTSRNILSEIINLNKSNLIICDKWRKNYFNNLLKKNDVSKINYLENEKQNLNEKFEDINNSVVYENLIFEIDFLFCKKYNLLFQTLSKYTYRKLWIIINNYNYNEKLLTSILSCYSNSKSILEDKKLSNIFIKNSFFIKNKFNFNLRKLKFTTEEKNNYDIYINKFKKIYQNTDLSFENNEYLRKYCCYPHKNLNINYFNTNLLDTMKINPKFKDNFISNLNNVLNNSTNCLICLNDISPNNLGITDCGHIFCYSCLYKSINIKAECPNCRNNISTKKVYLYDPENKEINNNILKVKLKDEKCYIKKSKTNKLTYQLESELVDSLGTKFSYLIKMVRNLKYVIIISNYDYILEHTHKILKQLNLKSRIINNKKIIDDQNDSILLLNYNNNYNKIEHKSNISTIVLNEPYYYKDDIDKREKYTSIINCLGRKIDIYSLFIENSIEEKFLFGITGN